MEFHPDGSMKIDARCPACGDRHTAARNALDEDHRPAPGDWTVCFHCANALRFTDNFHTRIPSDEEIAELRKDNEKVYRTIVAMQVFVERKQRAKIVRLAIEEAVGGKTPPNPEHN